MRVVSVCIGLILVTIGIPMAFAAVALPVEQVSFQRPAVEPTRLRKKLAAERGAASSAAMARSPLMLRGELFRPSQAGARPAVVLLHGCDGPQAYQRDWARRLASWGFVALLVDSFATRGVRSTCAGLVDLEARDEHGGRVFDAYAARDYLAAQSYVSRFRIGVMGWAYDAVLATLIKQGAAQFYHRSFAAAVSLYPDCGFTSSGEFLAPLLVLTGSDDDWTPASTCERMRDRSHRFEHPVSLHVYPGAEHGFDNPAYAARTYLPEVRNLYRNPARGAHLRFHSEARRDAETRVHDFFDRHLSYALVRGTLDDLTPSYQPDELARAVWSVDPQKPGPSLPVAGYSLFDKIFADGTGGFTIPFPFAALIDALGDHVSGPGGRYTAPVSLALFPMGRSLQREAAAPDYFRYPRAVLGVTGEPREYHDGHRAPLLRDRLYIGHVETTDSLEVISYNPVLGRFEFQIVENYRRGATPKVYYANRASCIACHQNQAPIFPNAPWDETNINAAVLASLQRAGSQFFGRGAHERGLSVNTLDRSANRANALLLQNLLWRRLCEAPQPNLAARCRASLAQAVLQFRLSNGNGFWHGERFDTEVIAQARRNWQRLWPNGLKVAFANIPDRAPLANHRSRGGDPNAAARKNKNDVPALLDPLTQRVPEAIWRWQEPLLFERIVALMAEQQSIEDARRLDQHLLALADRRSADFPKRRHPWRCQRQIAKQRGLDYPQLFTCTGERNDRGVASVAEFRLSADLSRGRLDRWRLDGGRRLTDVELHRLPLAKSSTTDADTDLLLQLRNVADVASVRLPNGNRVSHLRITLPQRATAATVTPSEWRAKLTEITDFEPVARAFDTLAEVAAATFAESAPLDFSAINRTLFAHLGLKYPSECCNGVTPTPQLPPAPMLAIGEDAKLAPFARHCRDCHAGTGRSPPSFLSGERFIAAAKLSGCAERIAYRLAMWQRSDDERLKSPMPPLPGAGYGVAAWPLSDEFQTLLRASEQLLAARQITLQQVLKTPYSELHECHVPD